MKFRTHLTPGRTLTSLAVFAGFAFAAPSALAVSVGESVSGTTLSALSLTAGTGAVFATNFSPGNTATGAGALTATSTNTSWTLQVKDGASSNAGKLAAAATGCTGSDANLANPLQISVTSPLGGVTSAGTVSISGTNQTVASATNQLLAANVLTTNYSQTIPASEVMLTGCVYSLTATYTLQ
jgi:hypothetical protein